MNPSRHPRNLTIAALLCAASSAFGATIAHFDDGVGTGSVDAYTGMAGGGWLGAWTNASVNGSTVSGTVLNTTPLVSGSGNYLRATLNGSATNNANTQGYTGRVIDPTAFDFAEPIVLSFDFRPDTAFSSASSQFRILQNAPGMTGATGPNNLWTITSGVTATPTWNFGGSATPGGTFANNDSGISVVTGHVYSFELTLDMTNKSYVGTVTDLDTNASFTSGVMYFRYQTSVTTTALEFGALLATGGATTGQSMSFSVDNISISQVPEPSAFAVLLGAGALAATGAVRRRRGVRGGA